mmetsp:Transcript_17373/g.34053  ORF Transcript_17373/g.34053 Transcript_17373/m.34053 type:complete len:246 (-) Transcript_17373:110-847(-)
MTHHASYIPRRRSSVTNTEHDVDEAIEEAFASLDKNGTGCLSVSEIERGLKHLCSLKDPHNDTDSICAALDRNGDGRIDPHEFHGYIHPTVVDYVRAGKPLDVQDIMRDAFCATIESDKEFRNKVIQAFMQATADAVETQRKQSWALPVNKGWMHKLYDDTYDSPTSEDAPRYKHGRGAYLFQRLRELQMRHAPKSDECLAKAAYIKQLGCPSEDALVSFCLLWQTKLVEAGAMADCGLGKCHEG